MVSILSSLVWSSVIGFCCMRYISGLGSIGCYSAGFGVVLLGVICTVMVLLSCLAVLLVSLFTIGVPGVPVYSSI